MTPYLNISIWWFTWSTVLCPKHEFINPDQFVYSHPFKFVENVEFGLQPTALHFFEGSSLRFYDKLSEMQNLSIILARQIWLSGLLNWAFCSSSHYYASARDFEPVLCTIFRRRKFFFAVILSPIIDISCSLHSTGFQKVVLSFNDFGKSLGRLFLCRFCLMAFYFKFNVKLFLELHSHERESDSWIEIFLDSPLNRHYLLSLSRCTNKLIGQKLFALVALNINFFINQHFFGILPFPSSNWKYSLKAHSSWEFHEWFR